MVGLFVQGWAGTAYSGLMHVSPITISVIPGPPMQDAAVIPKNSVTWLPVLRPTMFRPGCQVVEFVDEASAVYAAPPDD